MSRVGKKPILLENVTVVLQDGMIFVKGPKGELSMSVDNQVRLRQEGGYLVLEPVSQTKSVMALFGMYRAVIANMVSGVTLGFKKNLELIGTGYRVQKEGNTLVFTLGYSHPIRVDAPDGIVFETEGQTKIAVMGIDRQAVGQVSANIRKLRPPDSYKGKGVRYAGEVVRQKAGKSVK